MTAERHRSRVMGLKESAAALGGVAGLLLVALVSPWITPHGIFTIAAALPVLAAVMALVVLSGRGRAAAVSTRG